MRERLPADEIERTDTLVRRSQASGRAPVPPCLPREAVEALADTRSVRAAQWSSMEDHTDRLRTVAEGFEAEGVVIDIVDDEDADSLVRHMGLAAGSLDGEDEPPEREISVGGLRRK